MQFETAKHSKTDLRIGWLPIDIQHATPLSRERAFNTELPIGYLRTIHWMLGPALRDWMFDVFPLLHAESEFGAPSPKKSIGTRRRLFQMV
jgi:hypothetical protein